MARFKTRFNEVDAMQLKGDLEIHGGASGRAGYWLIQSDQGEFDILSNEDFVERYESMES
jgi:hypothetical protein